MNEVMRGRQGGSEKASPVSRSHFCVKRGPLAADDAEGDGGDELHDEPHEAPSDELVGELRPQLVLVPYVLLLRHDLLDVSHVITNEIAFRIFF